MRINQAIRTPAPRTHEGAVALRISPYMQLRRTVLSCLLWEDEFYEDGKGIAQRIAELIPQIDHRKVAALAIEARDQMHLRHVPLLVLAELEKVARGSSLIGDTLAVVIQRPDELAEYLAIAAKQNGITADKLKPKLGNQVRLGLAAAFGKFSEYSLQKYNRDGAIKLRDVMRLCHPKPKDAYQAAMWKRLLAGELATPDTWEAQLSAGADKRDTFERLIRDGKLGYFALIRNLRNMEQAGVDRALVREAILARQNGADKVLPFRFVAAARHAPSYERELDQALVATIAELPRLDGRNVVLVDVSGSMDGKMSGKSELTRLDAAATLASMINADDLRVMTFSDALVEVPARRGMAGVEAITKSQPHSGTRLAEAITELNRRVDYDRLIVITDEQSHPGSIPAPKGARMEIITGPGVDNNAVKRGGGYLINVASARNGIGYGSMWTHLDGFSENVLRWIMEVEAA